MSDSSPLLRIGLPAYNGESTLPAALDSLLGQTFRDFELVVSDNASTDRSAEIIAERAAADPRVKYVRQHENIGASANFKHVLDGAKTRYFMWAACDDQWLPDFVKANVEVLESSPEYVCSVSQVEFIDESGNVVTSVGPEESPHPLLGGTYPLDDKPFENLVRFIGGADCNTRYYGVHRTAVIQRCMTRGHDYLASDWVVMARTLSFGKHYEIPEVLIRRGCGGASTDVTRLILSTNPTWLSRRWLPMLPMSFKLLFGRDIPISWRRLSLVRKLLKRLYRLNKAESRHHRSQLRQRRATQ